MLRVSQTSLEYMHDNPPAATEIEQSVTDLEIENAKLKKEVESLKTEVEALKGGKS